MIIIEKNKKNYSVDYNNFGEMMTDGRLTEESDGKIYKLREAIKYSNLLGRELTNEEMKEFEI